MAQDIGRREPDPVEGIVHRPPDSRPGWQLLTHPASGKPFAWWRPDPDGPGMDAQVIFPEPWPGPDRRQAWRDQLIALQVARPEDSIRITGTC